MTTNKIDFLYHFTDKSNLSSIIENDGLYSWDYCKRKNIPIKKPGGNDTSRFLDLRRGLENYIHLTFSPYPPMLHIAKKDGRISNPIVLQIYPIVVCWENTIFSNINATDNGALIGGELKNFKSINFKVANQSYDSLKHDDIEKKQIQAEVLVKEHLPLEYIIVRPYDF